MPTNKTTAGRSWRQIGNSHAASDCVFPVPPLIRLSVSCSALPSSLTLRWGSELFLAGHIPEVGAIIDPETQHNTSLDRKLLHRNEQTSHFRRCALGHVHRNNLSKNQFTCSGEVEKLRLTMDREPTPIPTTKRPANMPL